MVIDREIIFVQEGYKVELGPHKDLNLIYRLVREGQLIFEFKFLFNLLF
jgi:hypothetical protein